MWLADVPVMKLTLYNGFNNNAIIGNCNVHYLVTDFFILKYQSAEKITIITFGVQQTAEYNKRIFYFEVVENLQLTRMND